MFRHFAYNLLVLFTELLLKNKHSIQVYLCSLGICVCDCCITPKITAFRLFQGENKIHFTR